MMYIKLKASTIKNWMDEYLDSIVKKQELREKYIVNPKADFTRNRTISLQDTVKMLCTSSSGTLDATLSEYYDDDELHPTPTAHINAMKKIKQCLWEDLFYVGTEKMIESLDVKTYKGYQLFAIDGTDLALPKYDEECFISSAIHHGQVSSHYAIHINPLLNILSGICHDIVLQMGATMNEQSAAVELVDNLRTETKSIIEGDRAYLSYNLMAHIIEAGHYFLLRSKDGDPTQSIGSYWWDKFGKGKDTGSINVTIRLTRANTKAVKSSDLYHALPGKRKFDFLPQESPFKQGRKSHSVEEIPSEYYYEISFRVVRVRIGEEGSDNEYELLVTNLPEDEFTDEELKELYHLRWTLETYFRELKHDAGLLYFHAKRTDFIIAEIYAKLLLQNLIAGLCTEAFKSKEKREHRKIKDKDINHSNASRETKKFLRKGDRGDPEKFLKQLATGLVPIKENRSFPRRLHLRGFYGFGYRAA